MNKFLHLPYVPSTIAVFTLNALFSQLENVSFISTRRIGELVYDHH